MKELYSFYTIQPVSQSGKTIATSTYENVSERKRMYGEVRDFSGILKEKEQEREALGYEKSQLGDPMSFYNKEAEVFFLRNRG
jgi:hypothetical protein